MQSKGIVEMANLSFAEIQKKTHLIEPSLEIIERAISVCGWNGSVLNLFAGFKMKCRFTEEKSFNDGYVLVTGSCDNAMCRIVMVND